MKLAEEPPRCKPWRDDDDDDDDVRFWRNADACIAFVFPKPPTKKSPVEGERSAARLLHCAR